MNIKKIRKFRKFVLLFMLVHAFSWFAVPIHLQNINRCSESDICDEYEKGPNDSSIYASYPAVHSSKPIPKLHKLLRHDENHCPICSLAQNKILSDSPKSQAVVVAMDWLPLYREKIESFFSVLNESIRAPPLTSLLN